MDPHRFPAQCFQMLRNQSENCDRINWARMIKNMLFRYGFGEVWVYGPGHTGLFLAAFRQRLEDCAVQDWHSEIQDSTRIDIHSIV